MKNNICNNSILFSVFHVRFMDTGILKYTDCSVILSAQAGCNPRKNRNISCLGDEYAERLLFIPIFYAPLVFARCRSPPLSNVKHPSAWNKEEKYTGLVSKNVTRDVSPTLFSKQTFFEIRNTNKSIIFY